MCEIKMEPGFSGFGKLNKRSFRYTRIWYTLLLVNFNGFCQHSSVTEVDEICDTAVVRDISTSDAVFKTMINNTTEDFPYVECLREGHKDYMKNIAILPFGFGKS